VVKYYSFSEKHTTSIFRVTELTEGETEVIWRENMFECDCPNSIKLAYIIHTLKREAVDSSKMPKNLATTQSRNPKENHHLMYIHTLENLMSSVHQLTLLTAT
jgi:hypothetical protein